MKGQGFHHMLQETLLMSLLNVYARNLNMSCTSNKKFCADVQTRNCQQLPSNVKGRCCTQLLGHAACCQNSGLLALCFLHHKPTAMQEYAQGKPQAGYAAILLCLTTYGLHCVVVFLKVKKAASLMMCSLLKCLGLRSLFCLYRVT